MAMGLLCDTYLRRISVQPPNCFCYLKTLSGFVRLRELDEGRIRGLVVFDGGKTWILREQWREQSVGIPKV